MAVQGKPPKSQNEGVPGKPTPEASREDFHKLRAQCDENADGLLYE